MKARGGLVLGAVVSVVALGAVVAWALDQPAPRLPDGAGDWLAVAGALAAYAVATAVRAERWGVLVRDQGGAPSRADLHALTVVGFAGNTVLPARGGDAFRVLLGGPRFGLGARTVIGTLLAERLLDLAVLVVLFVVLALTLAGGEGLPSAGWVAAGAAALALGAAVALALWRRPGVRELVAPVLAATAALRGRHGVRMLGATGAIWLVEGVCWSLCGAAVDVGFGVLDGFYVLGLAAMFALVPSGPGYAGTVDAAAVLGVRAVGGSARAAVSYVVLLRFVVYVPITVVGLAVGVARYGLRRPRAR